MEAVHRRRAGQTMARSRVQMASAWTRAQAWTVHVRAMATSTRRLSRVAGALQLPAHLRSCGARPWRVTGALAIPVFAILAFFYWKHASPPEASRPAPEIFSARSGIRRRTRSPEPWSRPCSWPATMGRASRRGQAKPVVELHGRAPRRTRDVQSGDLIALRNLARGMYVSLINDGWGHVSCSRAAIGPQETLQIIFK